MPPCLPETRANGPGWSRSLQHVQHCRSTATLTLPHRTSWERGALLTVLLTVVLITIPTVTSLRSYGYAFPQTSKEQSFQPERSAP